MSRKERKKSWERSSITNGVIVDTSFLYALFDGDDAHHAESVAFARRQKYEYFTTSAIVTEAAYLLSFSRSAQVDFLRWLRAGSVAVVELTDDDLDAIIRVIEKYADLPADYADSTLVAIADRIGIQTVISYDSDFLIYRYRRRYRFKTPLLDTR